MSNIKITCSVNAGLSVVSNDFKLLVDPFPVIRVGGFSALSEEMLSEIFTCDAFQNPDIIFITHAHPDHYDAHTMIQFLTIWPNAKLVMPECPFADGISLTESYSMTCGDTVLHFFPLLHQGEQYADVPHYGLFCIVGGRTILFTGDGIIADENLKTVLDGVSVDTAVLPFPWVVLRRGIKFIDQIIAPKHIVVNHLPLPQDDVFHYKENVDRYCHSIACTSDFRIMNSFMKGEAL